ncbi:MAG: CRTAC1 family protein [Candidatus Omnitrophota bacterium]
MNGKISITPVSYLIFILFFIQNTRADLSNGDVQFTDITKEAGVDFRHIAGDPLKKNLIIEAKGGGIALFDADGDGWLDIYFVNGGVLDKKMNPPPRNRLYRNNRDGAFSDITDEAGVGDAGWGMGCAAADYDNDGDVDLYVTNYGDNRFYRNDGKGHFTDIIDEAGCQSSLLSTGVSFGDYDLDGCLDLVVADYLDLHSIESTRDKDKAMWRGFLVYPGPRAYKAQGMSLFHNKGDGTFENVTQSSGFSAIEPAYSFTCLWADVNNDRYPDLYVSNDSMPSYLLINKRDGTFEETGLMAGIAYSEDGTEMASMGAAYGDMNGDFEWDLSVANFSEEPFTVHLGNGDGTFADITYTSTVGYKTYSALGWGVEWMDADNDGDEDLFFCNGHVYPEADSPDLDTSFAQSPMLYENMGNNKMSLVEKGLGNDFYKPRIGRGCAQGDLDNDGDLDLVLNNLSSSPAILRNDGGNKNNWLQLVLVGAKSNRQAIGAKVKLISGTIRLAKGLWSGSSFLSQDSAVVHLGLGRQEKADLVEIVWPSGESKKLENVKANQRIVVKENE